MPQEVAGVATALAAVPTAAKEAPIVDVAIVWANSKPNRAREAGGPERTKWTEGLAYTAAWPEAGRVGLS